MKSIWCLCRLTENSPLLSWFSVHTALSKPRSSGHFHWKVHINLRKRMFLSWVFSQSHVATCVLVTIFWLYVQNAWLLNARCKLNRLNFGQSFGFDNDIWIWFIWWTDTAMGPPTSAFVFKIKINQGHSPNMMAIHICHRKDATNEPNCFVPKLQYLHCFNISH